MRTKYLIALLTLALALAAAGPAAGQDPRLAQLYKAPLQLNPAMTGFFQGKMRVAVNYRDLYSSLLPEEAFRTYAVSADMRFKPNRQDFFALGVHLLRDETGTARFSRNHLGLSAAYLKQLSGGGRGSATQFLIAGVQIGGGQYTIRPGALWFSSQYDDQLLDVNFDLPSGEGIQSANGPIFPDLAAGLVWYAVFGENASLFLGGAVHHLAEPDIGLFADTKEALPRKFTIHGGGEVPFTREWSLLPGFAVLSQGPSLSSTAGGNLRYTHVNWREISLRAGAWAHLTRTDVERIGLDAVTVTAILELEGWQLGLSYDLTWSALRRSNYSRGAFEVSFTFINGNTGWRGKVECPTY